MNERIKKLRKTLDLTQQAFADRIGIRQNTIAKYETNRGTPTTSVISLICREFNVSETWLRTGEGEMFVPKEADALDELAKQYDLSAGDYVLVEKFLKLRPAERQAVLTYMQNVVSTLNAAPETISKTETTTSAPAPSGQEQTEPDLAAKVKALERQNQELAAKVAAMEEEDALTESAAELSVWPSASAGNLSPVEKTKNSPGET